MMTPEQRKQKAEEAIGLKLHEVRKRWRIARMFAASDPWFADMEGILQVELENRLSWKLQAPRAFDATGII